MRHGDSRRDTIDRLHTRCACGTAPQCSLTFVALRAHRVVRSLFALILPGPRRNKFESEQESQQCAETLRGRGATESVTRPNTSKRRKVQNEKPQKLRGVLGRLLLSGPTGLCIELMASRMQQ